VRLTPVAGRLIVLAGYLAALLYIYIYILAAAKRLLGAPFFFSFLEKICFRSEIAQKCLGGRGLKQ
jgi:hypothetical protein